MNSSKEFLIVQVFSFLVLGVSKGTLFFVNYFTYICFMGINEIIRGFIDNWAKSEELYLKIGIAKNISETTNTFDFYPIDETAPVLDVRLQVLESTTENYKVVYPLEDSKVVVAFHSKEVAQCVAIKNASKEVVYLQSKDVNVSNDYNINCNDVNVSTNDWSFNNGSLGGLIKINQLEAKLNNLVTEVNDMAYKFNIHTHAGVETGGGVTNIPSTTISDATSFNKNDFENTKIKH